MKDRWLWAGLVVTFASLYALQTAYISYIQTNEEEDDEQPGPPVKTALSLRTLRVLLDSTNPSISHMAADLVLARLQNRRMHSDVYELIEADAASTNSDIRSNAITTRTFLEHRLSSPEMLSPAMSVASTSQAYLDHLLSLDENIIPSIEVPVAGWTAVPRERPSAGDHDVRRRRREAVVLHEGAGEVNEDDIIRPRSASI